MKLKVYQLGPILVLALACPVLFADDDPAIPGPGFPGDHYEALWTKSPFAVATPDAPAASADYQLVGIARFEGISYASLIDRQANEHFVVSTDKPYKNITLVSITRGKNGSGTTAVIQRNGEALTLNLEAGPSPAPSLNAAPAMVNTPIMAPSGNPSVGGMSSVGGVTYPAPIGLPPLVRIHRPPIHVPLPPPGQ